MIIVLQHITCTAMNTSDSFASEKQSLRAMIDDFLAQKRIAVAGISRSETTAPANLIYEKLKAAGHEVYALNPHASEINGDLCYPHLTSLPQLSSLAHTSC